MKAEPLLYETHMHTPLCRHASGQPEAYARVASERGLKGIIVTCHNPIPNGYARDSRMSLEEFPDYLAMVTRAREAMAAVADVRLGLECDYAPGLEGWLEQQLASAEFHYVLGSIHPQVKDYRRMFWQGDMLAYQQLYFEHLVQAAETGLFDALSHPDLVKNEAPDEWQLERVLEHVQHCLDRIAATGVAMELNTSGLNKAVAEMNPSMSILREMKARDIPVVIGADAHVPERVGDNFDQALDMLAEVGYSHVNFFLERQRRQVPIESARQSLLLTKT
jgi:histidinol-phosphatase (PHP family)